MKTITRSITDWLIFFRNLNDLKEKFGSKIISETIFILKRMEQNKLVPISYHSRLINSLCELGIDDLNEAVVFLNKISSIYSFSNIIERMEYFRENYDIDSLAIILDDSVKKEISTYFNNYGYRRVYHGKDIIPMEVIDFASNGLSKTLICNNYPFIVEEKSFAISNGTRTLFTSDFNLNIESLPKKKSLSIECIQEERKKLFIVLLNSLEAIDNAIVKISVNNPNQSYDNIHDYATNTTINGDGVLFNDYGEVVMPSKICYNTPKLYVRNASFVVLSFINKEIVREIRIIIEPDFLKNIFSVEDNELKNKIVSLIEREKEGIETSVVKSC